MAITAYSGPLNVFGQAPNIGGTGNASESNPHRGPSLVDQSLGIMDPRIPFSWYPGGTSAKAFGWLGLTLMPTIDAVPSSAALDGLVLATTSGLVANTALTLTAGTGTSAAASVTNANTGVTVTGLIALGGSGGAVSFGSGGFGGNNIWDPTKCLSRNVTIGSSSSVSLGATFKVSGFDIYGYPMTEIVVLSSGSSAGGITDVNGVKAFKYIQTVTPTTSDTNGTYRVGIGNFFGLPLRCDNQAYLVAVFGSTSLAGQSIAFPTTGTSATFVAALATSLTAGSSSGANNADVRGLISVTADGTKRLNVFQTPTVAKIAVYSTATYYPIGLVGCVQA